MTLGTTQRGLRFWQGLLWLAALDAVVLGGWGVARPADLFTLLQQPPSEDGLLLSRLLGLLYLVHALFLLLAVWRPATLGRLVLVPLLGRLALGGVWLWLLESGRMPTAVDALLVLLAHDLVWTPAFAGFLWSCRGGAFNARRTPV